MTVIYLDPSALWLASPDPAAPEDQLAPGAETAVRRLVDAGYQVMVVGQDDDRAPQLGDGVIRTDALPSHLPSGAWYVTGEPRPDLDLPRGGTTVLVGPRQRDEKVPLPQFDVEARDIAAAAMEILTREAMA